MPTSRPRSEKRFSVQRSPNGCGARRSAQHIWLRGRWWLADGLEVQPTDVFAAAVDGLGVALESTMLAGKEFARGDLVEPSAPSSMPIERTVHDLC